MRTPLNSALLAIVLPFALAAQGPNTSGTWVSESDPSITWVIAQTPEDIHVQEINGDKTEADFTCPLSGRVCEAKENGHSETIMMYFNGGKLVMLRERGSDSSKEWLTVSADGNVLTIEGVPLSSKDKASKTSFRRKSGLKS